MKPVLTAILMLWLLAGCASEPPTWDGEVRVHGALRAMIHDGDTGNKVTLDEVLPAEDLVAVGSRSSSRGSSPTWTGTSSTAAGSPPAEAPMKSTWLRGSGATWTGPGPP